MKLQENALPSTLPADATERSHDLLATAREIADRCPPDLAAEIDASGSVARGVADQYSDIEIDFWCTTMPPAEIEVG